MKKLSEICGCDFSVLSKKDWIIMGGTVAVFAELLFAAWIFQ